MTLTYLTKNIQQDANVTLDYPMVAFIEVPFALKLWLITNSTLVNVSISSSVPIDGTTMLGEWFFVADSNFTIDPLELDASTTASSVTLTVTMIDTATEGEKINTTQVYDVRVSKTYTSSIQPIDNETNVLTGVTTVLALDVVTSGVTIPIIVDIGDGSDPVVYTLKDETISIDVAYAFRGFYKVNVNALGFYANILTPSNLTLNVSGPPACSSPRLKIQNAAPLTSPSAFLRSNTITITGITSFSCAYNYTNSKEWSLVKVDPETEKQIGDPIDLTLDSKAFKGHDQAILVIYPLVLNFGVYYLTYTAKVIYSMDYGVTYLNIQGQASTYFQIVRTGLNVFGLQNGILQQTYAGGQEVVLDPGTFSVDMDMIVDPSSLSYLFYCQKVPSGQSTSAYFQSGGAITRLGSLPNMFQVFSSTFGSNCFSSRQKSKK
jgi:hypothetical protein